MLSEAVRVAEQHGHYEQEASAPDVGQEIADHRVSNAEHERNRERAADVPDSATATTIRSRRGSRWIARQTEAGQHRGSAERRQRVPRPSTVNTPGSR